MLDHKRGVERKEYIKTVIHYSPLDVDVIKRNFKISVVP